jgi:hypothetical protein
MGCLVERPPGGKPDDGKMVWEDGADVHRGVTGGNPGRCCVAREARYGLAVTLGGVRPCGTRTFA